MFRAIRTVPAAVVLAAACVSVGAISPIYAQARYASKAGFSFVTPARWKPDTADISMERMRYTLLTPDGRVVASIQVRTLRDKKDATLDSLIEGIRQRVKENNGTELIVRDKAVTLGKTPGAIIETNNTRSSEPDTEMTLFAVRNGIVAQVVMMCKTADRARYAPVFSRIVETFQWK